MAHTEKGAAYMADGYAKATGRPGVVIAQGGPGAANLAAGLADAYQSSTPIIGITKAEPVKRARRKNYQEVTTEFRNVTKFDAEVTVADRIPDLLQQAYREATSTNPRPVHLAIQAEAEAGLVNVPWSPPDQRYFAYPAHRIEPEAGAVAAAVDALSNAKRPVIVAGGGLMSSGGWRELFELATRLDIPVATTLSAKGAIPENHPLSIGVVGTYPRPCANTVVRQADLVFFIGSAASAQTTDNWTAPTEGTRIIHINIDPTEIGRNYAVEVPIVGDATTVLRHMLERTATTTFQREEWTETVEAIVNEWRTETHASTQSDSTPIRPERLMSDLTKCLPQDVAFVADTGYVGAWASAFWETHVCDRTFFRCEGSLGWAFPASIGIKCGLPHRPVVCFTGDGGLWYHLSELETAVRYGINIVVVVLNNSELAFDSHILDHSFGGASKDLSRFLPINFADVAKSIGAMGIRVENPSEIEGSVERALSAGRPCVVDVVSDPSPIPPLTSYVNRPRFAMGEATSAVHSG
jgi:acetolactate synthase-1/2/3 large subunit